MNKLVLSAMTPFVMVAPAAASSHDNISISTRGQERTCNHRSESNPGVNLLNFG